LSKKTKTVLDRQAEVLSKSRIQTAEARDIELHLGIVPWPLLITHSSCEQRRSCVDSQNRLLPDSACQAQNSGSSGYYGSSNGGAHYIYGGSSGGRVGDAVMGGSVSRGGFGGIGGSGEGGGE